jgi:hypothetical protein
MPGSDLSQPAKVTSASMRSACITHSIESAMISRLTSEARMPSWPIEMPSDTAMVTNSIGNPPAAFTPCLQRLARRSRGRLQGVTSFQLLATPTWALDQSSSVIPMARSMARAGARAKPSVTSRLRRSMPRMLAWIGRNAPPVSLDFNPARKGKEFRCSFFSCGWRRFATSIG